MNTIRDYSISYPSSNILFCVTASYSTEEFPEDQYYFNEALSDGDTRKPLPLKEILERDSKLFIDCGFVNINNFINYQNKIAFLYPNETGQKVYRVIQKLNLEKDLYNMCMCYEDMYSDNNGSKGD